MMNIREDDFLTVLGSLGTLMFASLTRWSANPYYFVFETLFKSFLNSRFFVLYGYETVSSGGHIRKSGT